VLVATCLFSVGCDNGKQPPPNQDTPSNEQDAPPPTEPVDEYVTLKVGTYNICHCADVFDGYKVSPDKTAGILYRLGYDIVGLNEVYESGGSDPLLTNQAKRLTMFSGLTNYFFGLGAVLGDGCTIGNAVLSKYRLTDKQTIAVPIPENKRPNETNYYEDRVIVKTTVNVTNKLKIDYISIHAGINALEQENMITALLEVIDKSENPIIVCGDFNMSPEKSRLKPLRERLVSAADVMGKTNEKTITTAIQDVTADYVFLSKEFEVISYSVEQIMTSDHFPIVVEVKIKNNV
jgi:endonuclease/exonuclease/phosphatase family metal-dependent hydrolase